MTFKKRKILDLQTFFTNCCCNEWLLVNKKGYVSSEPRCKAIRIC